MTGHPHPDWGDDEDEAEADEIADFMAELRARPPEPVCDHDFQGWREFEDGRGGEQVCTRCGIGAVAWSLRFLP